MAERSLAQQLTDADAAIEAIQKHGQSYTIDGIIYNRGSLRELREERRDILQRIAHESTHGRTRVEF